MDEINRTKIVAELVAIKDNDDPEVGHIKADDVLCALLVDLGYDDVVGAYRKIRKWYA